MGCFLMNKAFWKKWGVKEGCSWWRGRYIRKQEGRRKKMPPLEKYRWFSWIGINGAS